MNQFLYDTFRIVKYSIICFLRGCSPKAALCCDISFEIVPSSTRFPHPVGIVIGPGVIMGENCTILQNVTIGRKRVYDPKTEKIIIGDSVIVYSGAIILGPVTIGNNAIVGAGAIVTKDVPSCTIVFGINNHK